MGVDIRRHICGRAVGHAGGHYPWPDPQNGYVTSELPMCGACGMDVTGASHDGAVGYIQVGEQFFHVGHEPKALVESYPYGPDPEDREAWREAEEAAAERRADHAVSDPADWEMGLD